MRETAIHKGMGLTLDLGMERGKIACHKSEARDPTARGTPREPGFGDEAFWRSQVNFGPPKPATDEKDRGSVYLVTLPAFQRCLEDGPEAAERGPGSGFPTSRGTGDGHLQAHHDLQASPARPTRRLGVRGSIVPAAVSPFIFEVRDLFSAREKNQRSGFDSAQPNDTSNTNDLCRQCVAGSLF